MTAFGLLHCLELPPRLLSRLYTYIFQRPAFTRRLEQRALLRSPILLRFPNMSKNLLVEPDGIEPTTSCLQGRRSSQLSYGPD